METESSSESSAERSLSGEIFPAAPRNRSKKTKKIRRIFSDTDNSSTTAIYSNDYMTPYRSQFAELSVIGYGGFGLVVKAKHHLDGIDYAVKKVCIEERRSKEFMKCLEEVQILAQLNHANVVGYKQAWIEPCNGTEELLQFSQSSQSGSQVTTDYAAATDEPMVVDGASQSSHEDEPRIVLYIQMSLCHQNLREWMNERKGYSTSSEIEEIMTQILHGLRYIHSRGVIHHDMKPQNIFISVESEKISVQLGDFGLACKCQKIEHSQEFGTLWYAAPEQLEKKCDPKSDIYSCGIILFELLYPMMTDMERHDSFSALKSGKLPAEVEDRYPFLVQILKNTINADPNLRSTAGELLDIINSEEDSKVTKLKEKIQRLEEENVLLKAKIANHFNN